MHTRTSAIAATALVLVWSTIASAAPVDRGQVVIRVYDAAGLPPAVRRRALGTATTTLRSAGVAATWIDCSNRRACDTPLRASELAVRVVRLPMPVGYTGDVPLAESLIDPERRSGVLATVYFDRVQAFASTARTDVATLLARTMAHEIGHLLAGTDQHDPDGLMRPVWTVGELRRNVSEMWEFDRR